MFREMRRKNQLLTNDECAELLENCTAGVLAVSGDDDYPYGVPLSYVYDNGKFYFHCAKTGHKLDAIARNPKASFTVIHTDDIVPEEYTTYFRSVIAFGKVRIVEDPAEIRAHMEVLANRYRPGHIEERDAEINSEMPALCILEMTIDHMTGKSAIEFIKADKRTK